MERRCEDFIHDSKLHYLPFAKRTNHKDAFKGPIFKRVLSSILKLKKDCGCWMRFGGEAPIDYMLFVRREGNRMEVRYGDAKHYTLRKKDPKAEPRDGLAAASCKGVTPYDADHLASLQNKLRSQHDGLVKKAREVHAGLKEGLGKLSLSLDAFKKKARFALYERPD